MLRFAAKKPSGRIVVVLSSQQSDEVRSKMSAEHLTLHVAMLCLLVVIVGAAGALLTNAWNAVSEAQLSFSERLVRNIGATHEPGLFDQIGGPTALPVGHKNHGSVG